MLPNQAQMFRKENQIAKIKACVDLETIYRFCLYLKFEISIILCWHHIQSFEGSYFRKTKCNHDALMYTYTNKTYYIRFILWYKSCWFISCFSITWIFSCLYLISSVYPKKEYCNWNTAQKSGRKEVGKQKIGLCLWCKTYLYRIHKRDIDERHFCVSSLKRPLVSFKTIIVSIEEITSWMKIDHPRNLELH